MICDQNNSASFIIRMSGGRTSGRMPGCNLNN